MIYWMSSYAILQAKRFQVSVSLLYHPSKGQSRLACTARKLFPDKCCRFGREAGKLTWLSNVHVLGLRIEILQVRADSCEQLCS